MQLSDSVAVENLLRASEMFGITFAPERFDGGFGA